MKRQILTFILALAAAGCATNAQTRTPGEHERAYRPAADYSRSSRGLSVLVMKGDKVVFISYKPDVFDHPRDQQIEVRLMDMDGGNVETLFELFGGQGTMNSPNWSPAGDEFAYVRYFPV